MNKNEIERALSLTLSKLSPEQKIYLIEKLSLDEIIGLQVSSLVEECIKKSIPVKEMEEALIKIMMENLVKIFSNFPTSTQK